MQGEVIGITSFGILTGQNLNFVIPISYAKPLLASDRVRPLAQLAESAPRSDAKQGLERLVGTYTGLWQSKLSGAGALALTVDVENGVLRANAAITGSPSGYKGDSLTASNLKDMGDGVWSVDLTGEHSELTATGIFKPGSFVGDFTYKYNSHRRPDRGQSDCSQTVVKETLKRRANALDGPKAVPDVGGLPRYAHGALAGSGLRLSWELGLGRFTGSPKRVPKFGKGIFEPIHPEGR